MLWVHSYAWYSFSPENLKKLRAHVSETCGDRLNRVTQLILMTQSNSTRATDVIVYNDF